MLRYLREAEAEYKFFGTLTVGSAYSAAPEDFRAAVDRWLTWFTREQQKRAQTVGDGREAASTFWFVEFQYRGAPHLHMFYTHYIHWRKLADKWAEIAAKFGLCTGEEYQNGTFQRVSTNFQRFRRGFRGMLSYARKYAIKQEQKQVPTAYPWRGRFWGVRGNRSRVSCHVVTVTRSRAGTELWELKSWLEELHRAGKLRKVSWEYGEGAIYFPIRGEWADQPSWMVQGLESRLQQAIIELEQEKEAA